MLASHTASLSSDGSMPFPSAFERVIAPDMHVRTNAMSLLQPLRIESVFVLGMDLMRNMRD